MPAGVSARNHPRYSPGAPGRGTALANAIRKSAKKVQRFLRLGQFTLAHLWPSLLAVFLKHHVRSTSPIYLAIDRTTWGQVNLLMVSLVWQKRSIPVYWQQLARLGNSNEQQQIAVLTKALALLADHCVVVLGDREFCSVDLARWLGEQGVYFCLRQKKSTYLKSTESDWQRLGELPLTPGTQMFFNTAIVAKGKGFDQAHLAAKWKRRYRGFAPDEPWYLLTNLATLDDAISAYQKRFDIEEMFRDFKGGGYQLEQCKAQGKRFTAIVLLCAIAYLCAATQGNQLKRQAKQRYLCRPEERYRTQRRHSSFRVGLGAYRWAFLQQHNLAVVLDLIKLDRNKMVYHQRGLRAMSAITSTF